MTSTIPYQPTYKTATPIPSSSNPLSSTPTSTSFNLNEGRWWSSRFHFGTLTPTRSSFSDKGPTHYLLPTLSNSIVQDISFSPLDTKKQLAVASGPRIGLYSDNARTADRYISLPVPALCCSYRQDGRLLAIGGNKGLLKIVDVGTRATLKTFGRAGREGGYAIRSLAWLRDGKKLLSGGDDGLLKIWDLTGQDTTEAGVVLKGHGDAVRACCVVKDSVLDKTYAVSGSYDHTVRVWDMEDGACLTVMDHGAPVEALLCFKDVKEGRVLIASAGGTTVKVWDAMNGKLLSEDSSHAKTVSSMCFVSESMLRDTDDNGRSNTRKGRRILTGGIDGLIRIYDADTLQCLHGIKYKSPISSIKMSQDGKRLVVGTADGMLSVRHRSTTMIESKKRKKHMLPGSYSFFNRGAGTMPQPEDHVVTNIKKKKHKGSDLALKKFRYSDALDEALNSKNPAEVSSILEELGKRRGLQLALSNRDEETLEPILAFTTRYIAVPKYSPILISVANFICTIYEPIMGQSPLIDELFVKLRRHVGAELRSQRELLRLLGMIDTTLYASTEMS